MAAPSDVIDPNTADDAGSDAAAGRESSEGMADAGAGEAAAGRALEWVNRHGGWLAALLIVGLIAGLVGYRIGEPPQPGADSVDVGFLQDMYTHHDQAVEMSLIMASEATNPIVQSVAQEIVVQQRFEQGAMAAWLGEWGHDLGDFERTAMAWMGTPTPIAEMDGMQSSDEMAALRAAEGPDKDLLFLEMMNDHHRGGVHMSEYAQVRAEDPRVRRQAELMATNQAIEIEEMNGLIQRLEQGEQPGG